MGTLVTGRTDRKRLPYRSIVLPPLGSDSRVPRRAVLLGGSVIGLSCRRFVYPQTAVMIPARDTVRSSTGGTVASRSEIATAIPCGGSVSPSGSGELRRPRRVRSGRRALRAEVRRRSVTRPGSVPRRGAARWYSAIFAFASPSTVPTAPITAGRSRLRMKSQVPRGWVSMRKVPTRTIRGSIHALISALRTTSVCRPPYRTPSST